MSSWVKKGLKTGIVSTYYPKQKENAKGITPGLPSIKNTINDNDLAFVCPTNAIYKTDNEKLHFQSSLCIHCRRCSTNVKEPLSWSEGFEWALLGKDFTPFSDKFRRSLHICVVDGGDCGACLNETKILNNPFYNMHRLGFFITPSPRKADILLVVGAVTEQMKGALLKAYNAMPTPKKVMAVGTCTHNGGIFKGGFIIEDGVSGILPVDITIPGCPPPPLAILDGLLILAGYKNIKKVQSDE